MLHTGTCVFQGGAMRGQDDIDALQKLVSSYIKKVRKTRGWSMTETGRQIGSSKTTIARNENPPANYRYVMSTTTLRKLAQASGIALPKQLLDHSDMNGQRAGFAEDDVAPYEGAAPGKGTACQNPNKSDWIVHSRALELAGYVPGDIVTIDQSLAPRDGDIVIAQIYDDLLGTSETVMRRYQEGSRQPFLMAAATDQALMAREPDYVDNERVKVMGVIVRAVRTR